MKTLVLLRHAKSTSTDGKFADFDRTLSDRGRKDAGLIGRYIKQHNIQLDFVLSSPAARARETTESVLEAAELSTEARYDKQIYEATPLALLEVVSEVDDDRKTILLDGHNPGMEELLGLLTGHPEHMSPAALARIEFEAEKWTTLAENTGKLVWMINAKELSSS
jgi:phosphohistidine phosphatase